MLIFFKKYGFYLLVIILLGCFFFLPDTKEEVKLEEEPLTIKVDIKGAVNKPGVYEFNKDERVEDAIKKSGGFTEDADTTKINLSEKLEDEMVIIVQSKEVVVENNLNAPINNLISINSGTIEELMTLPGIGESKALAIIDYRKENGQYHALDELMNVTGIGESVFAKIKDKICL